MTDFEVLIQRELLGEDASGNVFPVVMRIGMPYRTSDVSWACPFALDPLYGRLADISGIDSWQAVRLCYQLAESLLEGFVQKGGVLRLEQDNEPMLPSEAAG